MNEYKWLSREAVEIMHAEQVAEHGGLPGLKDENALEAAMTRPLNEAAYGANDLFALAAAYLYGIVRNHPFSDGNNRASYLAAFTFLYINGYLIEADDGTIVAFVQGVAAGEIDEIGAMQFLKDFCVPLAG
ncbi:type II toxin-antitoxin system death-on-curing family toxin [Rhizobium sp. P40RR-XXII]|uniref:type II toxin-antitoxin system death-on-curing family toxin n=1 Tax=unclassified Rhizobium TaxID=2613769 RepID=UPI00145751F6|nr:MULTISPECIES: type II toxin-antitoxin system death-on-curing family toxin [unclassified Rhizobium]NLR87495.1 type II toxin-antitoxin system death-on-curing family toxin [Rhizobium sp. P28RR-XV]NLS19282.1 type II toxin-antitoxin system death-on-curing family toxin [Rhizobium sp. P40RR-XXII]